MMKNRKGQVALEGIFVVLFIVVAVASIMGEVTKHSNNMGNMATIRAELQGFALDRSLRGTTTHFLRVDPDGSTSAYKVYFVSEKCLGIDADMASYGLPMGSITHECNYAADLFTY